MASLEVVNDGDPFDAVLVVVLVVASAAAVAAGVVFGAAQLTYVAGAGEWAPISVFGTFDAIAKLSSVAGTPGAAWVEEAPGLDLDAWLFWSLAIILAAAALAAGGWLLRRFGGHVVGSAPRQRLGVDANPWLASARELSPLFVGPNKTAGRFVFAQFGRRLLATQTGKGSRWSRVRGRHPGGRGAVAIIGPSQSGKTTGVIAGLLDWDGPAVVASVKTDLVGPTIGWRAELGEVAVFDPADATEFKSCSWSPLRTARDFEGAAAAAKRILDTTPRSSGAVKNEAFWDNMAQQLLATALWVAATSGRSMRDVVRWIATHDGTDLADSEMFALLDEAAPPGHPGVTGERLSPETRATMPASWESYEAAIEPLRGISEVPTDTRSSIYATAQSLVWPWSQRAGAASARGVSVDLGWLTDPTNDQARTLYLTAPLKAQERYQPVLGGLLADLFAQVFDHHSRTGGKLDPPLLVIIDEAGNTPLDDLPQLASTLSGLGVQLVTVWQSKAQLDAKFGTSADTVLTNHPTKLFFSGLSDPATLNYLRDLTGSEHVGTRSVSRPAGLMAVGQRNETASTHELPLIPAHVARQQPTGSALMVHGNLPPAEVRGRYAAKDRRLRRRVDLPLPPGTATTGPRDPHEPGRDGQERAGASASHLPDRDTEPADTNPGTETSNTGTAVLAGGPDEDLTDPEWDLTPDEAQELAARGQHFTSGERHVLGLDRDPDPPDESSSGDGVSPWDLDVADGVLDPVDPARMVAAHAKLDIVSGPGAAGGDARHDPATPSGAGGVDFGWWGDGVDVASAADAFEARCCRSRACRCAERDRPRQGEPT